VLDNVMTGSKLMAWMNNHPGVRSIPRVILTGGIPGAEADKWMHNGAKCVLEKGTSLEEMRAAVEKILKLTK
jgi:DNA-binding NtrC family response regulator